jgi:valyl-tRNA synthetase
VWHWWHEGSVHTAPWPTVSELGTLRSEPGAIYDPICEALEAVRRQKSESKVNQRTAVTSLDVSAGPAFIAALQAAERDLVDAGNVRSISYNESSGVSFSVELESPEA